MQMHALRQVQIRLDHIWQSHCIRVALPVSKNTKAASHNAPTEITIKGWEGHAMQLHTCMLAEAMTCV